MNVSAVMHDNRVLEMARAIDRVVWEFLDDQVKAQHRLNNYSPNALRLDRIEIHTQAKLIENIQRAIKSELEKGILE